MCLQCANGEVIRDGTSPLSQKQSGEHKVATIVVWGAEPQGKGQVQGLCLA